MSDFVLDASVALAMYLPATDAQRRYADKTFSLILGGAVPAIPALFDIEVTAALLKARRSRLISGAVFNMAIAEIGQVVFDVHHVKHSAPTLAEISQRYMLTGYDAVYFDLAMRLNVPLASLDKGHRSACKHHNVSLLTFT